MCSEGTVSVSYTHLDVYKRQLGHSAMGGFKIPTPWDQLYKLKPTAPQAEQRRVMQIAAAEAAALSVEDRLAAVRSVTDEVFSYLLPVVPSFLAPAKLSLIHICRPDARQVQRRGVARSAA